MIDGADNPTWTSAAWSLTARRYTVRLVVHASGDRTSIPVYAKIQVVDNPRCTHATIFVEPPEYPAALRHPAHLPLRLHGQLQGAKPGSANYSWSASLGGLELENACTTPLDAATLVIRAGVLQPGAMYRLRLDTHSLEVAS